MIKGRFFYWRTGVYYNRLHKKIRKALLIIGAIYKRNGEEFCLVTSTNESSEHRADSFHYQNKAIDIKHPVFNPDKTNTILRELINELGSDYDVVKHISHYHIEYDPKK